MRSARRRSRSSSCSTTSGLPHGYVRIASARSPARSAGATSSVPAAALGAGPEGHQEEGLGIPAEPDEAGGETGGGFVVCDIDTPVPEAGSAHDALGVVRDHLCSGAGPEVLHHDEVAVVDAREQAVSDALAGAQLLGLSEQPVLPGRTRSPVASVIGDTEQDLPELLARLEPLVRSACFGEREHPVDHGRGAGRPRGRRRPRSRRACPSSSRGCRVASTRGGAAPRAGWGRSSRRR